MACSKGVLAVLLLLALLGVSIGIPAAVADYGYCNYCYYDNYWWNYYYDYFNYYWNNYWYNYWYDYWYWW